MRKLWVGLAMGIASPLSVAQTTIYKHVDEAGRVTYSNQPMKGAAVIDLEPLTTIPGLAKPTTIASVDREPQRGRDELRRKVLEEELAQREKSLAQVRQSLLQEQRNPTLIAAVRLAQQTVEATPAQQAEMRANIDRASGRIRGLQATVAEHEKKIEALKKELGATKP